VFIDVPPVYLINPAYNNWDYPEELQPIALQPNDCFNDEDLTLKDFDDISINFEGIPNPDLQPIPNDFFNYEDLTLKDFDTSINFEDIPNDSEVKDLEDFFNDNELHQGGISLEYDKELNNVTKDIVETDRIPEDSTNEYLESSLGGGEGSPEAIDCIKTPEFFQIN